MSKNRIQLLAEVAIFATLAMVLDIFTEPMQLGPWISFSFKMIPIFIVAFRRGVGAGMSAGFLWGLLKVVTGEAASGILSPLQGFLEYFIAFTVIGLAGLAKPWVDKARAQKASGQILAYSLIGVLVGTTARYIIHFIAGFVFWGQYAPEGQSAVLYSLSVNGLSWFGETLACVLVIWLAQPMMTFFLNTGRKA
ncbi:energy-coupled thiamine transporter ThiT [Streptococcus ovuberis]|uniref:Energy-coupled thiamine transporter ThiT n=1 Tax=Streptococcus ovuberis TaxID=1936207 RepID=A0A7X6MZD6_9STRE|nr:energy-coupled thiamine transporter ThiT [Streptococcus ovuberis]NKZ20489.1 energy-coupled thiamine transporter ThiT [Streptococcus ovuberis]